MLKRAIILLSGGLDSATTLAIAKNEGYACYALSVDYQQRHSYELKAAKQIAESFKVAKHLIVPINLRLFGGSSLTDDIPVPENASNEIPITYVPARNTIFLSLALAWAEVLGAADIFIGVNAIDYSGYPDCRPHFISAFQGLAQQATKAGVEGKIIFNIRAPLVQMTKAEVIKTGLALGVDYRLTVSCYQVSKRGKACGRCDSCRIRSEGFRSAMVEDPTLYKL